MQDDVVTLFEFDRWANGRMFEACRKLTAAEFVAEPAGVAGWSSVRATVYHIAMATEFNLRALGGGPEEEFPAEAEVVTVDDAAALLERAYGRFERLRPLFTPEWLGELVTLSAIGRKFTLPRWAILRHVVNHSSYHRGQVASKVKRFGVEMEITDLFWWVIEGVEQER